MSTSGTTTWKLQRDAIITAALRKLSVLSGGTPASAQQITEASEALNAMIKGFQADGMPVWAMKSYTFTTIANQAAYQIGNSQALNTPMPLKVVQAWRSDTTTSNIPLNVYTDTNYNQLPLAFTSGTPVNLYYQPQMHVGTINLWPKPADATITITLRYQRPFEDMTSASDDIDFPPYWTEAIIYGLADRLAPEYGIPLQDRQLLTQQAERFHGTALGFGMEEGGLFFQPDYTGK
jgi:hypothetical protein